MTLTEVELRLYAVTISGGALGARKRKLRINFAHVVVRAGASFRAAVFDPPKHTIQAGYR